MKKAVFFVAFLLIASVSFAQQRKDLKLIEESNLIEATYYHDNGEISQKGTFDLKGKLHGEWVSFDEAGEKISIGSYDKGVKTGKWFFWDDGIIKEVEFDNNIIASVTNKGEKNNTVTKN